MPDHQTYHPQSVDDVIGIIAQAIETGEKLDLRGGGTKAAMGAPNAASIVDMRGLSGIVDYDPAELVMTVRAGTPLAEVEALLLAHNQMLAFEPFDHGPVFGAPAGSATIGGIIAAGVAGSRRLSRGGARDYLLGFKAVSGRAEAFLAGAKVTKNVTGYDLPKLACNSWGRLFALTELNLKTLPRSETSLTVAVDGMDVAAAVALMSRAMGSQASISAAAHNPLGGGVTAVRIGGFGPSVMARKAMLLALVDRPGQARVMEPAEADAFWAAYRTLSPLAGAALLWRVMTPPKRATDMLAALAPHDATWMMDWAGGLLWLACADAPAVRQAAQSVGGHAQLARAPEAVRQTTAMLHPQASSLAALETRVRRAFDPVGVFETGRFWDI